MFDYFNRLREPYGSNIALISSNVPYSNTRGTTYSGKCATVALMLDSGMSQNNSRTRQVVSLFDWVSMPVDYENLQKND